MIHALQIVTVLLLAVAMALPLAHLAELPGKMRLDEPTYRAVQPIYYPGFTIVAGIGEFGGLVAASVLLLYTPRHTPAFAWLVAALATLVVMHAVFWLVTQPVNLGWLAETKLSRLGTAFFRLGARRQRTASWMAARNVWEWSHAVRALLGLLALAALVIGVTSDSAP